MFKAILSLPTGEEKYDSFKNIIKEYFLLYIRKVLYNVKNS